MTRRGAGDPDETGRPRRGAEQLPAEPAAQVVSPANWQRLRCSGQRREDAILGLTDQPQCLRHINDTDSAVRFEFEQITIT